MIRETIRDSFDCGKTVRLVRKEQGLSQRDLAQKCGCSQRFVSELERGKRTAELGKALEVLAVLGVGLTAQTKDVRRDTQAAIQKAASRTTVLLEKLERNPPLADYL